jgi:hypothetical protein
MNINWADFFCIASISSLLISFVIFMIVGWAHGGGYNMLPWDPALKNKISPLGIKFLNVGTLLILLAVLFGLTSFLLTYWSDL